MSDGQNNPGISALAAALSAGTRKEDATEKVLDFGEIMSDGSLLCNTYNVRIPKNAYTVCRSVALPNSETVRSGSTTAKNQSHSHSVEGVAATGSTGSANGPSPHAHSVSVDVPGTTTGEATSGQDAHSHTVDIARASQRRLQPGDHVLVAWVGNDAVVIDIIMSAASIL